MDTIGKSFLGTAANGAPLSTVLEAPVVNDTTVWSAKGTPAALFGAGFGSIIGAGVAPNERGGAEQAPGKRQSFGGGFGSSSATGALGGSGKSPPTQFGSGSAPLSGLKSLSPSPGSSGVSLASLGSSPAGGQAGSALASWGANETTLGQRFSQALLSSGGGGLAKAPVGVLARGGTFGSSSGALLTSSGGGPEVIAWAKDHTPCAVVCLVAGFLPEEIVERALKQLLVLVRDTPTLRLLILDVSQRREWSRTDEKPFLVEFVHKFNKDRRDNVRVCVMDATSEAGGAVPGVKIESLPATMVFQAGKLTSCGVVHGFTRNNTQAIEASVRQCTSKGGSAAPLSSAAPGGFGAGQSGAGPKDIAKLGPSEPLSLPQGIDLCSVTAEGVFKAAHARVQSLEAKIHAGKQAGTGQGAMLGNELKAAEMDAESLLAHVGELRFEKGASSAGGSRAKRLHDLGRATSSVVSSAEQLLDVCAAQGSIQGYLYADIATSRAALDPKADWIVTDMALLRSTGTEGGVSPKKVSPLAKTVRSSPPPTRAADVGSSSGTPIRQVLFSRTVTGSESGASRRAQSPSMSQSPCGGEVSTGGRPSKGGPQSAVKGVIAMVRNMKVGTSPLGPANRKGVSGGAS